MQSASNNDGAPADSEQIKKNTIATVVRELINVASTESIERSFITPKHGIYFKDKVMLLNDHFFLRNYKSLEDLDKALDYMRKVILMGDKELQRDSNKWLKDNDDELNIHQILRRDLDSAKIIDDIFGNNLDLADGDLLEILDKCRKEEMNEKIKPGFLGLGTGKKKQKYTSETELASHHLQKMQESYREFIEEVSLNFDTLERKEFFQKYNFNKYLK